MDHKPTLRQLRELYRNCVTIDDWAEAACLSPDLIYLMLRDQPVSHYEALRALDGLSQLVGTTYTLDDVEVASLSEDAVS